MSENQTGEYYFKQMKCSQRIKFKRNLLNKFSYPKHFFRENHSSFENMVYAALFGMKQNKVMFIGIM